MKEHYRLTKLGECKPGDRVWFIAGMNDPLPLTVCWQKFKGYRCAHRTRHQLRRYKKELEQ